MTKTIASLALLKTNWDNQPSIDFIDLFIPFVVTLLNIKCYDVIDINTVCMEFEIEFGLSIPYHPMITILNRTRKRGYLSRRKDGRFVPKIEKIANDAFTDIAQEQERKYIKVVKSFLEYCKEKYDQTLPEEQADKIIISFIKDHDLDVLFAQQYRASILPEVGSTVSENYLINSFVRNAYESEPEIFDFIVSISVGHIIASTILYDKDQFERYKGQLRGNYYLDSGLLFNLVGINGPERKKAYEAFLSLLRQFDVKLLVFKHTYEEFIGILERCMNWIGSTSFDPAKASRALTFFKENNCSVSDIELFINNMDNELARFPIEVIEVPEPMRDQVFQIDENQLHDLIVKVYKDKVATFDEEEKEFTIIQDIKSLNAIYKLRRGHRPMKISDAEHILITTNASLAYASRQFELKNIEDGNPFFIPAALTDVFIGTLTWIHSPSKVVGMNEKRLIANCYAALQPKKTLLRLFINNVESLNKRGVIKDNEVTLLKASRVARNLLSEDTLNDPDRFTDNTVTEILEEIKNRIREEEAKKFDEERETQLQKDVEKDQIIKKQQADLSKINQELSHTKLEITRYQENAKQVANIVANIIGWLFYIIGIILVIIVLVFPFKPEILGGHLIIEAILTFLAILFAAISLITGFNFKGSKEMLRNKIRMTIQNMLLDKN